MSPKPKPSQRVRQQVQKVIRQNINRPDLTQAQRDAYQRAQESLDRSSGK